MECAFFATFIRKCLMTFIRQEASALIVWRQDGLSMFNTAIDFRSYFKIRLLSSSFIIEWKHLLRIIYAIFLGEASCGRRVFFNRKYKSNDESSKLSGVKFVVCFYRPFNRLFMVCWWPGPGFLIEMSINLTTHGLLVSP